MSDLKEANLEQTDLEKTDLEQTDLEQTDLKGAKEWLRNNSKFSLWEWLYNSISPNKHQRQYR